MIFLQHFLSLKYTNKPYHITAFHLIIVEQGLKSHNEIFTYLTCMSQKERYLNHNDASDLKLA